MQRTAVWGSVGLAACVAKCNQEPQNRDSTRGILVERVGLGSGAHSDRAWHDEQEGDSVQQASLDEG